MEAHEASEKIQETAEEEEKEKNSAQKFRNRAVISIAIMALLLAITSMAGNNVSQDITNTNIITSDTWAFYQAKNIRQTNYRLAAEELELLLPAIPKDSQSAVQKKIESYKATAVRYESEPDPKDPDNPLKGDGKKELSARARNLEEQRKHAQMQSPNFDYSAALYQIAIVLGSVAIVASSKPMLYFALSLGAAATILMINGFFLLFRLPIIG